jgi:hypothetical protein
MRWPEPGTPLAQHHRDTSPEDRASRLRVIVIERGPRRRLRSHGTRFLPLLVQLPSRLLQALRVVVPRHRVTAVGSDRPHTTLPLHQPAFTAGINPKYASRSNWRCEPPATGASALGPSWSRSTSSSKSSLAGSDPPSCSASVGQHTCTSRRWRHCRGVPPFAGASILSPLEARMVRPGVATTLNAPSRAGSPPTPTSARCCSR